MHEANFELIEIPHVRLSGKNSADIRMVVDALDLCYTKSHVDTFVIISGDSDFSPLVSKLRENAKKVIGVGVKQSTSDLLVANCDEFIFYDDLVRESRRAKRDTSESRPAVKRTPEEERARREEMDKRRNQAVEIAVDTFEALVLERGDSGKIWASVLKEAIKRRKPDFSESYYGFRTFGNLIEECKARGHLEFGRDEKSGAYVYRGSGVATPAAVQSEQASGEAVLAAENAATPESRRSRNRGRTAAERFAIRQAERQARAGQDTGEQPAHVDAGESAAAQPAAEPARELLASAREASAPVAEAPAPAKKKNGTKPPARKMKAAHKQKVEQQVEPQGEQQRETKPEPAPVVAQEVAAPSAPEVPADQASAGKPAGKGARGTANKSANKPAHKPANKPADKPADKPANKAAPAAVAGSASEQAVAPAQSKPARKPAARKPRPPKAPVAAE